MKIYFTLSLTSLAGGIILAFTRVIEFEIIGVLMVLLGAFGFLISASVYSYRRDKARGGKVNVIYYILGAIGLVVLRVLLRG